MCRGAGGWRPAHGAAALRTVRQGREEGSPGWWGAWEWVPMGGEGRSPPTCPLCPPSREGGRHVHAAVVREEAGPADGGDGLRVQGRLLGGQGEAGVAHVPQHLLSVIHSCKYRRLHSPGHLVLNALNLVLNGYPTPPFAFPFLFFFFNNTFLGASTLKGGSADPGSPQPPGAPGHSRPLVTGLGPHPDPNFQLITTTQAGWPPTLDCPGHQPHLGRNWPLLGSHF